MVVLILIVFVLHAIRYSALMISLGAPMMILTIALYLRRRRDIPKIKRELEELSAFLQ
jgi:hypothetical protein